MASPNNFVVTSLPAYVDTNRDIIIKNFALTGPGTRKYIGLQTGIKKDAYLNYLDLAPTLQDGSVCDASPAGSVTLSQRTISTSPIQVVLDICTKNLLGKYAEYLVKIGAGEADLPFEQYIIDTLTAEINKRIETLIWQGNKSSSDPNLKWIDGLLSQTTTFTGVPEERGDSSWTIIKRIILALPEEVLERDARVFVNPALFRSFGMEMVSRNFYHYEVPDDELNELTFPGTSVKVTKAPGLVGRSVAIGTFGQNFVYGCDVEDDTERVIVRYDEIADVFKVRVAWNSGVAVRFPEMGAFYVYNEAVIGNPTTPLEKLASAVRTVNGTKVIGTESFIDSSYRENGTLSVTEDGL